MDGIFRKSVKVHEGLDGIEIVHGNFQRKRDSLWQFLVLWPKKKKTL